MDGGKQEMSKDDVVVYHSPEATDVLVISSILKAKSKKNVNFVSKPNTNTPTIPLPSGLEVTGGSVFRYLARVDPELGLYGKDAFSAAEVDQWLDAIDENKDVASLTQSLNTHLTLRTYVAGHALTVADIALWRIIKTQAKVEPKQQPHVARWLNYLDSLPEFGVSGSSKTQATKGATSRTGSQGSYNKVELPHAKEGAVVTRFPPEPSGYLHIGHAKAALLNNYYATAFNGKLVVRFDDTNPVKEKEEYVDAILQDIATLGIVPGFPISYTSDYFDLLLKYAEQFIRDGNAYVDTTDKEQIKYERMNGIESKCRNNSVEENLRLWEEMKKGSEIGAACVLRAKIDMTSKNKALRDPAIYRCIVNANHARTGKKYKVYPLYDFACPIVDSIEGVTHSLRSNEYHDRNFLYYWVADCAKLRRPYIQDFSRLNFAYTCLSKRKLQWFVDKGLVWGWDDPRFPTIRGLVRRGLTIEALREFVHSQGASKSITLQEPDKLWAVNKKIIDPIVPRYTAVAADGKVLFKLTDVKEVTQKSVPRHKKNPSLGNKVLSYTPEIWLEKLDAVAIEKGEEVTLMDWGNAIVDDKIVEGESITLVGHLNLAGSVKNTKKKLTWLPNVPDLIPLTLYDFGPLITKKSLEKTDKFEDFVNYDSVHEIKAVGDPNLRLLSKGDKIQLERRGYFICDQPFIVNERPMVLFEIPDGHTAKAASVLTTKPAKATAAPPATKN